MKLASRGVKWTCVTLALALVPVATAAAGAEKTVIAGTDDWPIDSVIDAGTIRCSGGDIVWVGPLPTCPSSGQLHLRDAVAYSCVQATASDAPEPRLTGVALFTLDAEWNADYAGPVRGGMLLVPAEVCDPQLLDAPDVYWEGIWRGKREMVCEGESCHWVGALKLGLHGYGGALGGLHFQGTETVLTFTPLPLPYELLPGFCDPCPPEGLLAGTIFGQ